MSKRQTESLTHLVKKAEKNKQTKNIKDESAGEIITEMS